MVTITPDGPDQASLAKARTRIDVSARVSGQRRVAAFVALGVAVAFVGLAVVAGWGWLAVALVGPIVAAYQWRSDVSERRDAAATAAAAQRHLAGEIDSRIATLTEARTKLTEEQSTIDENLKTLREALS
jgi:hypothetical protein